MLLLRRRPALHAARQLRQAHTELCGAVLYDGCPGADGSGACPPSCKVDRLLRNGADANEGLPLLLAKSPCIVRRLLAADPPADVSARWLWGETALHRNNTRPDVVAVLLAGNADPNAVSPGTPQGDTVPLSGAAPQAVRLMLDAGADPNATSSEGDTPLHAATTAEAVALLLAAGADVHARNSDGETPLHHAPSSAAVQLLLEGGADPNAMATGRGPPTALHRAAQYACVESVRLLLASGAVVDARGPHRAADYSGAVDGRLRCTPLHSAAFCRGGDACVRELLAAGADPNACNSHEQTPLHDAASGEVAALLLAAGADVHARNSDGETPLHASYRRPDVIGELVNAGADVNARDAEGRTPLMRVSSDAREAQLLLAAGGRVGATDDAGDTALHHVARFRVGCGAVDALLAAGADPNAVGSGGRVPLHLGVENAAVVDALLTAGARPDQADDAGRTPLFGAIQPGGARLLLWAGADPNAVSLQGETPLHALAGAPRTAVEAVAAMIKAGADVNAVDASGATPLHHAALWGPFSDVWRALVGGGGDESATDAEGRTAREFWRASR